MTKRYYVLPARFFDDCIECDAFVGSTPAGWDDQSPGFDDFVVGTTAAGRYVVLLTAEQAANLRSRATYYVAQGVSGLGSDYIGLVSSARATVRAIDAGGGGGAAKAPNRTRVWQCVGDSAIDNTDVIRARAFVEAGIPPGNVADITVQSLLQITADLGIRF